VPACCCHGVITTSSTSSRHSTPVRTALHCTRSANKNKIQFSFWCCCLLCCGGAALLRLGQQLSKGTKTKESEGRLRSARTGWLSCWRLRMPTHHSNRIFLLHLPSYAHYHHQKLTRINRQNADSCPIDVEAQTSCLFGNL
jgi:hypothetical protein